MDLAGNFVFTMTEQSCVEYDENQMVALSSDFRQNPFFERWMVYSAIKTVIGSDAQVSFKCVETIDKDDSDDLNHLYAGKFGSNSVYYLESSQYWMSIPTMHFENIYMMKADLIRIASQNIFKYLNYLFYLAIFLTPAATGLILLLMKDLKSFYDYQGVVFSVFRYLNRQGDQQMFLWMNKILAFIVAIFFFFHYAILLSEMTALRTISLSTSSQYNRDSYRAIQTSQIDILNQGSSYYFLYADTFQFHFLKQNYIISNELQDSSINHYNLLLSKTFFTEAQYQAILLHMLELSSEHSTLLSTSFETNSNVHSTDVFYNWLLLAAALLLAVVFYLIQSRFSSINQYTEIKSFREGRNRLIANIFHIDFKQQIERFITIVYASSQLQNFKQILISKKMILIGKQVFRIIEKKRKKLQKHRRKQKFNTLYNTNLVKSKQNLYQVIKGFIDLDRKGKIAQTPRLNIYRRKGISPLQPQQSIAENSLQAKGPQRQQKLNLISSNLRRVEETSEVISPEAFKRRRKGSHEEFNIFQSNKLARKMSQLYPSFQVNRNRNIDISSQSHSQQISPAHKHSSNHYSLPQTQEILQSQELEEPFKSVQYIKKKHTNFIEEDSSQIVNKKRGVSSPGRISKQTISPLQSDNNFGDDIDEGPLETVIRCNPATNRNIHQFQEQIIHPNSINCLINSNQVNTQNMNGLNFQSIKDQEFINSGSYQLQLNVDNDDNDNELNRNENYFVTPVSGQVSTFPFGQESTPEKKDGINSYDDNPQLGKHIRQLTTIDSEITELLRFPEQHLKVSFKE